MLFKSYSKVNFFLTVFPKNNKNKLHKIHSFFQLNKRIYDEVEIEESKNNSIEYFQNGKKLIIKNCIIKKVLIYFKKKYNILKNYKIFVKKNIPIGSGLGGASSNASIVIKFIIKNEKIKLKNFSEFLCLGSDIAFFMTNYNNAIVTNYGEIVHKMHNPKIKYKLFFNNYKCITKIVYNKYDEISQNSKKIFIKKQLKYLYAKKVSFLVNDLQEACFLAYPEIQNLYNHFLEKKVYPIICGSGSTMILFKRNQNEK